MSSKAEALSLACWCLSANRVDEAGMIVQQHYPFAPDPITRRQYGPVESARVFVRDGFIDRYCGERLVFPPVIRLLSLALPSVVPFHPNWKTDVTHPAYWEIGATVDHVKPVTMGGADDDSNWVTTSMARNSAKMNWSLEALGWRLHPPGLMSDWDGLLGWFLDYTTARPEVLGGSSIRAWARAGRLALGAA